MTPPGSAFVVIDVQQDFLPSGNLPVPRGDQIVPIINNLFPLFNKIYLSKDWHPTNHISFASNHPDGTPFQKVKLADGTEQTLWPDHCVQHSPGAQFAPDLLVPENYTVVFKGTDQRYDSYSAFFDNTRQSSTILATQLEQDKINTLFVCGLATDVCVLFTVLDAIQLGFHVVVLIDACRGLSAPTCEKAIAKMKDAGAVISTSHKILA